MSFRCQFCNEVQPNGTPSKLVVTETHEVEQTHYDREEECLVTKPTTQIKVEKRACPACVEKVRKYPATMKALNAGLEVLKKRFSSQKK